MDPTTKRRTQERIDQINKLAPVVREMQARKTEADGDKSFAEDALLNAVVVKVKQSLHALCTIPLAVKGDPRPLPTWRGLRVDNGSVVCAGFAGTPRTAIFEGASLYLREDFTWCKLTGTGLVTGPAVTEEILSTEQVVDRFGIVFVIAHIAAALEGVATGKLGKRTAEIANEAAKIRAITTLLDGVS